MNGIFWHVLMFSICQHTLHFNIFYILQTEILLIFVPIFLFVSVFLVLHFEKKLKPFSLYQFSPLVESFEHRIFLPLNSEESNIWRWWTLSTSFSPLGLGQSIYLKRLPFQIVHILSLNWSADFPMRFCCHIICTIYSDDDVIYGCIEMWGCYGSNNVTITPRDSINLLQFVAISLPLQCHPASEENLSQNFIWNTNKTSSFH